jgi:uncharacterized membrane protein YbhN (UPF0104 family)
MAGAAEAESALLLPFRDPSRRRRLLVVGAWLVGLVLLLLVLAAAGVDVVGWIRRLWDTITEISLGYLVAGIALQTAQTILTAVGWYAILDAAYPAAGFRYRQILAAYAAGVALNGFLPANIGTVVMLLMFVAIIRGATFAGVLGGMVVQKIFFTVAGTAVYLYLFLSVPGSLDLELGGVLDHPLLAIGVAVLLGGALVALIRTSARKVRTFWENAKEGGSILTTPGRYAVRVVLPSLLAWFAKLGVVAVFLTAYAIPVTFHTVMSVVGGNSLANTVSATPGGIGVNQAINAAALNDVVDTATATAYSIGQQVAVTAWNIVFAVALVAWAFGWSGGRELVGESYTDAKERAAEQRAQRAARKKDKKAKKAGRSTAGPEGIP